MKKATHSHTGYILPAGCDEFFVISGSLSHIQRFIYDTASSGALKNLRGKSFYLTLLTRAACDYLLRGLNLQQDAVLYNSGGTFCIIAPIATDAIKADIDQIIKEIKDCVAEELHSDLINICYTKATRQELQDGCAAIFNELFARKHRAKFAPYGAAADYESLFACSEGHSPASYEKIGAELNAITAILVSQERLTFKGDVLCVAFEGLSAYFYFGRADLFAGVRSAGAYILLINNEPTPAGCAMPTYREFVAGNGTRVNSFSDLFRNESSSHQRLAVLRMDVDNLGALLQKAMLRPDALKEYSCFSHKLDEYFKEQINDLWRKKYSDSTVIIYAGGDDLFIVGEWETTLEFMTEINKNFKAFFGGEAMSISGGVALIEPKYPIIRAAEMSADEEQSAKNFAFNGMQKGAISIFNTPMRWDYEYKWVMEYQNQLYGLIQAGYLNESFIQHILRIGGNVTFEDGKIQQVRYIWLAAYDLSRMKKRNERGPGGEFITRCISDIMSGRTLDGKPIISPYHSLQLIIIAARLVEMRQWKNE